MAHKTILQFPLRSYFTAVAVVAGTHASLYALLSSPSLPSVIGAMTGGALGALISPVIMNAFDDDALVFPRSFHEAMYCSTFLTIGYSIGEITHLAL